MLEVGSIIPDFNLEASGNQTVSKDSLTGKYAVIVFYPANNTPG